MMTPASSPAELMVFAYGTLKQGFENHAHYCRGVTRVEPAEAWGRLHLWEPGIPILDVPRDRILLLGSPDLLADLEAAEPFLAGERPMRTGGPAEGGWRRIRGHLLVFPDPLPRLGLLDALEGFHPRTGTRAYERVLLTVERLSPSGTPTGAAAAWCYVVPHDESPPGPRLALEDWPVGHG